MTILFPRLGSPELEPFVQPFGRMMLAFGRAITAAIALAQMEHASEAQAVQFVSNAGTKDLPKEMCKLFRGKLEEDRFKQMDAALNQLKKIAEKRHHLIHGEWWFNVFDHGQLEVRKVHRGKIQHLYDVSAEGLDQWARELDQIADELDDVEYSLRTARERAS